MTRPVWSGTLAKTPEAYTAELRDHDGKSVSFTGPPNQQGTIDLVGEKPEGHWHLRVCPPVDGTRAFVAHCYMGFRFEGVAVWEPNNKAYALRVDEVVPPRVHRLPGEEGVPLGLGQA